MSLAFRGGALAGGIRTVGSPPSRGTAYFKGFGDFIIDTSGPDHCRQIRRRAPIPVPRPPPPPASPREGSILAALPRLPISQNFLPRLARRCSGFARISCARRAAPHQSPIKAGALPMYPGMGTGRGRGGASRDVVGSIRAVHVTRLRAFSPSRVSAGHSRGTVSYFLAWFPVCVRALRYDGG